MMTLKLSMRKKSILKNSVIIAQKLHSYLLYSAFRIYQQKLATEKCFKVDFINLCF